MGLKKCDRLRKVFSSPCDIWNLIFVTEIIEFRLLSFVTIAFATIQVAKSLSFRYTKRLYNSLFEYKSDFKWSSSHRQFLEG